MPFVGRRPRRCATLAQPVEQRIRNAPVVGSIPTGGSTLQQAPTANGWGFCLPDTVLMLQTPPTDTPPYFDRLYRRLAGDGAVLVLLALALLAFAFSLLLPQLALDPDQPAALRWLDETAARFGALGPMLRTAGLFDLTHSPWLRGLLGLLAFTLLLRLALIAAEARTRLRRPDAAAAAGWAALWPHQAQLAVQGAPAATRAELSENLISEGWRVTAEDAGDAIRIVAERSRWGLLAQPLALSGLLLMLAGLWLGQWGGWRQAEVILAPGQPVRLSRDHTVQITVGDAVSAQLDTLTVQRDGRAAQTRSLRLGGLATAAGLWLRRTGEGPAMVVSARDADGGSLAVQSVDRSTAPQDKLTLVFDQPRAEQLFLTPERQLVFSIVAFPELPERGLSGPAYLVQAFPFNQRDPITNQFIQGNANLALGEDVYSLAAGRYLAVTVSRKPGLPLLALGAALALAGVMLAVRRPAGRLLLTLCPHGAETTVAAALQASPFWRQAAPWLAAWVTTYRREG